MTMNKNIPSAWWLLVLLLTVVGCKKEVVPPPNPYDSVDYGTNGENPYVPDPASIVGLYENVFRIKCANPGCHDGHFEPDFRSIQSAWSTLVYHDIVKNTADSAYRFRVLPGNVNESILWYRVTDGDAQLQQMPATGQYLTATEQANLRSWIEDGARDMFGNLPTLPNNEPQIIGYGAFDQSFTTQYHQTENRLDSVFYNPFKIGQGTSFNVVFFVEDDSTALSDLQVNQLRLSLDKDNFAGSTNINAYYVNFGTLSAWVSPVNTSSFAVGDTVFMRYYVNDGDHAFNTEFPRDDQPDPYKTYASFYLTP